MDEGYRMKIFCKSQYKRYQRGTFIASNKPENSARKRIENTK